MTAELSLGAMRRAVDRTLEERLQELLRGCPEEAGRPIRHAVLAPGKRIRPLLLISAYRAAGGERPEIIPLACSVELVHTYSLIHDDLPCMDDDVLRRGRPTLHVAFGTRPAVLAGAALMPLAVRLIESAGAEIGLPGERRRALVGELTRAAGGAGMVGGQWRDLQAEGRSVSRAELEEIHRGKTARLIAASVAMGGMAAVAQPALLDRLRRFGEDLGLAFQVVDDILDVTGSSNQLGKAGGRDAALGKATIPGVMGLGPAGRFARDLAARARAELKGLDRADALFEIAELVVERRR